MLYKVFTKSFFGMDTLDKIKDDYDFLLIDNVLFVAPNHYALADTGLHSVFADEYLITELTELNYEAPVIQEWGQAKLAIHKRQRWEDENQDELRAKLDRLDKFEEYLKKGGE